MLFSLSFDLRHASTVGQRFEKWHAPSHTHSDQRRNSIFSSTFRSQRKEHFSLIGKGQHAQAENTCECYPRNGHKTSAKPRIALKVMNIFFIKIFIRSFRKNTYYDLVGTACMHFCCTNMKSSAHTLQTPCNLYFAIPILYVVFLRLDNQPRSSAKTEGHAVVLVLPEGRSKVPFLPDTHAG